MANTSKTPETLWARFAPVSAPSTKAPYATTIDDNGHPPVVFLHGFMMSRALWADNLDDLSFVSRPIVVEHLGHGRSPAPSNDADYSVNRFIDALEFYRKELGYDQWTLCAHSFGAGVALQYALEHPNCVSGVVFTNSLSAFGAIENSRSDRDKRQQAEPETSPDSMTQLEQLPYHPRRMKYVSASVRDALIQDAERLDLSSLAKLGRIAGPQTNVRDKLHTLQRPALLVNGAKERAFQPIRQSLEGVSSNLEIEDREAGHSVNAEMPQVFNQSVRRFLRELKWQRKK